jgi:hypothetical protein
VHDGLLHRDRRLRHADGQRVRRPG